MEYKKINIYITVSIKLERCPDNIKICIKNVGGGIYCYLRKRTCERLNRVEPAQFGTPTFRKLYCELNNIVESSFLKLNIQF